MEKKPREEKMTDEQKQSCLENYNKCKNKLIYKWRKSGKNKYLG